MKAKLLSIKVSLEKGKDRIKVKEGVLIKDFGLRGDAYAKPGDREVCMMSIHTTSKLPLYKEGLCVKRFVESLLIDLKPDQIKVGDVIEIGQSKILVTKKGKRCFPECEFIKNKKTCPLVTEPIFGKVIEGGKIEVEDGD